MCTIVFVVILVLVILWYRKRTGKFAPEKNAKVEVQNDLYGFTGQHNQTTDTTYNDDQECYEEYDLSNNQRLQTSTSPDDKQNSVLASNPLYGEHKMDDSMLKTDNIYADMNDRDAVSGQMPTPVNSNVYSDTPDHEPSEIYMNMSNNNHGVQMGNTEEYTYCKH